MNVANASNLIRCSGCAALYDKTISWARGYYNGTSPNFTAVSLVEQGNCPICGKKHQ